MCVIDEQRSEITFLNSKLRFLNRLPKCYMAITHCHGSRHKYNCITSTCFAYSSADEDAASRLQFKKNTTSAEQDSNLRPIAYDTVQPTVEVVSIQTANTTNCDENNNTGVGTSTCRSADRPNYPQHNVFQDVTVVKIKLWCVPHF